MHAFLFKKKKTKATKAKIPKKIKYNHCMSRTMHINVCFIRCHCRHRLLMHIGFNKCVILLNRWNSRRIFWLCQSHKRMWNHIESLHVIWLTLAMHYINFPYRYNIVTELHPSSIHFFNRRRRRSRMWQNGLDVPKLSYNSLWSVNAIKGHHLRWLKIKKMTSNSLNERWSPYGIQHTTSGISLSSRLQYIEMGSALLEVHQHARGLNVL